ncbi:hypothetical protein HY988_02595 [Candidatus Micrarchaeota archaeon]|nr:hypothetical protein [Candidatus Micrarchaeota archaeon]
MGMGKGAYLKKITSGTRWRSVELSQKMDGSSPPSVFIGNYGYPKVFAGPMIAPYEGDTTILDTPEAWIPAGKNQDDILKFRLELVRGKTTVGVQDFDNKTIQKLQEIALAKNSVDSEIEFKAKPRGLSVSEDHTPHGPSAEIEKFEIDNVKWDQHLGKAYYDTDLKANDAVISLYKDGLLFSQIQKALSTGSFGIAKNRKLVPTRWSITATDSALANHLYDKVKYYDTLPEYEVYEFSSLNNYYAVILLPTPWQYEWIEAFVHILGNEVMIFGDYEQWKPKKEYSSVGGCYYSCKFAALEALERMKKQAGAIVLREAYEGYVPMGVFNVRENVRNALKQKPKSFSSFRFALNYVSTRLRLPMSKFVDQGVLLRELLSSNEQKRLF